MSSKDKKGLDYAQAGVNIDAGNRAVQLMKKAVTSTYGPEVLGDIGGFGGLFSLASLRYEEPVLVSGTDGVGTKLRIALLMQRHDTVGQDVVAMSVNDILVQGARPLFFLDYIAVGKLDAEQVATLVGGVAKACRESGCALIGGETAEMAGFYADGDYDIAGFAVGIAERNRLITGAAIQPGDVLVGLPSSGLHSNGYSLVRKICLEHMQLSLTDFLPELGKTLGEELLTPTRLYPAIILPLLEKFDIRGMVHITGGGFYENIPRILPQKCGARVNVTAWPRPLIFNLLQQWGQVQWQEMYRTFNMGIGMILILPPEQAALLQAELNAKGETSYIIGQVQTGEHEVVLEKGEFGG